jgi:hypothetical protein
VEPPHHAELEVRLPIPDHSPYAQESPSNLAAGRTAAEAFGRRNGGRWQTFGYDPHTRTPNRLLGSGIETGRDVASDAAAEALAREVVAANPEVFGADPGNLRLRHVRRRNGAATVHFDQLFHGIPVWGGRVQLSFTPSGRLYAMGSQYYPDVDADPRPALSREQAEENARSALPFDPATDGLDGETSLLVLPVPLTPTDIDFPLVWRVRVRTQTPFGIWVSHVDAHDGRIIWRYNDVHFWEYSGDAVSEVEPGTYCNDPEMQPSAHLRLTVSGFGTFITDAEGNWNAGDGGTGTATVTADLYGPFVDMINAEGPEAAFEGTATAGVPFRLRWHDGNSRKDERDVFDAVNDLHEFFGRLDPDLAFANGRLTAYVNQTDPCRAYWGGSVMGFCNEGGDCTNAGEIQGIADHEYGHGVQHELLGYQGGEGLGEGNSDFLANLMTQDSIIARGFHFTCWGGLRDSENTLQYPDDVVDQDKHLAGRVIAGFHWDLMQLLQALHGADEGTLRAAELWHFARKLGEPPTQPAQVLDVFAWDDNPAAGYGGDGNLDNGTPHHALICEAATNHGFECPEIVTGVMITHVPLQSRESAGDDTVLAVVSSTEAPIDTTTVRVSVQRNHGAFVDIPMLPTGGPDEYGAVLTGLVVPTEVGYYIAAEDLAGNVGTSPRTATEDLHEFDVANVWEPFEADAGGWVVNLEGTDDATDGFWEHGDPHQTTTNTDIVQPEDDHTPDPGTMCWVTGNAATGSAASDDIDGGRTSLYTPVFNLSGASRAKVTYFRYFTNNRGEPGTEDWVVQARNGLGPWFDVERTRSEQNTWHFVEFDLFELYGTDIGDVQLKFVGNGRETGAYVEALVDDFTVLADFGGTVGVAVAGASGPVPAAAYLTHARPNPFRGRTALRYGISEATRVRLEIFDVTGRLVRVLVDAEQNAGNYALAWDGRDEDGRSLESGTYYGRLRADGATRVRKLTAVR